MGTLYRQAAYGLLSKRDYARIVCGYSRNRQCSERNLNPDTVVAHRNLAYPAAFRHTMFTVCVAHGIRKGSMEASALIREYKCNLVTGKAGSYGKGSIQEYSASQREHTIAELTWPQRFLCYHYICSYKLTLQNCKEYAKNYPL